MSTLHKHNPLLQKKLQSYIVAQDVEGMSTYLKTLSVGEFRTAGYLLGEKVLIQASNDFFWQSFIQLTSINAKAFLVTCLKAFVQGYKEHKFMLQTASLQKFATNCTLIDCKKTLDIILPILRTSDEVIKVAQLLGEKEGSNPFYYLVKAKTLPCYYALFVLLKSEDEKQIRQSIMHLVKCNEPLAYNVANALKRYFDINNIPVTFSLCIEDYQLSCLDKGYESFKRTITK